MSNEIFGSHLLELDLSFTKPYNKFWDPARLSCSTFRPAAQGSLVPYCVSFALCLNQTYCACSLLAFPESAG